MFGILLILLRKLIRLLLITKNYQNIGQNSIIKKQIFWPVGQKKGLGRRPKPSTGGRRRPPSNTYYKINGNEEVILKYCFERFNGNDYY